MLHIAVALLARRKGTLRVRLSAPLLALALFSAPAIAQIPSTCVVSGTVLNISAQPVPNTIVRFRVIQPTIINGNAIAAQDLTAITDGSGNWSLTLIQGLNAQVDIPAAGPAVKNDTVIPTGVSCPAAFSSLTLYARGTLTPATILSNAGPSMGGDLNGNSPNPHVIGLRGVPIKNANPTNGQALVYVSANGDYEPSTVSGNGVASVTGGTGISITGSGTAPVVNVATGGVAAAQLAASAAATNVGTLGGDLSGTLPSPAVAAGAITDSKVNAGAAIAWSKISKAGALPSDIGAASSTNAVTSVTAGTGITMGGTATAPVVAISNGGVTSTQMAAGAAATNLGAAGGDLTGTYPNPQIGSGVVVDADVNATANIAWSKISKAGSAESDITGLAADLADKFSKSTGGTIAGNTIFNGSATFNGAFTLSGSFSPAGELRVSRTGDATNGTQQKASNNLTLEGSVWNGGAAERRLTAWVNTPTALNAGHMSLMGYSTDNVLGPERSWFDTITGAFNGNVIGNVTGNVIGGLTGNVTGNASGTAGSITGNLTGDVTSVGMATTVALVNGSSAANVHAAELLANAATNANTASTIVKRDASNNFIAGTITANLTGNVTGALTGNASTSSDGLSSAAGSAPLTLSLAAKALTGSVANATGGAVGVVQLAGDLNGTATSPGVATVGGSTAANIHTAEGLANAATAANTPSTIVLRNASGNFTAGTITATSFAGPATSSTGTFVGDVTGTEAGTTVVKLRGRNVSNNAPADTNVLGWVAANSDWEPVGGGGGGGSITSVNASGGTTGFSFTGGPITSGAGTLTLTGTLGLANGGTNAATANAGFNNLSPMTTLGDLIYGGASGAGTRLAGNTTTTPKYLQSTGSAGLATAPTFQQINASTDLTGVLPIAQGGTGASSLPAGDVISNGSVLSVQAFPQTVSQGGTGATTLTGLLRGAGAGAITGAAQASLTTEVTGTLPTANGGTNATSWTTGSIPYLSNATTFTQDNANHFWDGTNHRLGIGTTTPQMALDVRSAGQAASFGNPTTPGSGIGIADVYSTVGVGLSVLTQDFISTTSGSFLGIYPGASTGNTYIVAQASTTGGSATGNLALNPNGGNVGIGTTAPTSPLTVTNAAGSTTPTVAITAAAPNYAGVTVTLPSGTGNAIQVGPTSGGVTSNGIGIVHGGSPQGCTGTNALCATSGTGSSGYFIHGASGNTNPTVAIAGVASQTSDLLHVYGDTTASGFDSHGQFFTNVNGGHYSRMTQGSLAEDVVLSTIGTTTDTTTNLLPANSVIKGVTVWVNGAISTATAFSVGDATIAARFVSNGACGLTFGSTCVGLNHVDQTGTSGPKQTAAAKVRITTTGTPSGGNIFITSFFETFTP